MIILNSIVERISHICSLDLLSRKRAAEIYGLVWHQQHSNNTILRLGQEAAAKRYIENLGNKNYNSESGGVPFRIYLDQNNGGQKCPP